MTSNDELNHRPASGRVDDARLIRLEEAHAFLDHRLDELHTEMIAVNKRLADLAARLMRFEAGGGQADGSLIPLAAPSETLAQAERRIIVDALSRAASGREQAAQLLGLDRGAFEKLLVKHGLA